VSVVAAEQPLRLGETWRAARFPVALVLVAAAVVALVAAAGSSPTTRSLDPSSATSDGARALATLLRERGVTVTTTTAAATLTADAVVVAEPQEETRAELAALAASPARLLVLDPRDRELRALGVPATFDDAATGATLTPGCVLPAARAAGPARIEGTLYHLSGAATACYHQDGDTALVDVVRPGRGDVLVLGSASTLTNSRLAAQGDAALALGLLDVARVQWLFPAPLTSASGAPKHGLIALLPSRLEWAVLQLFVAMVVLALWRARRLGRPVVEPLPVVVRAAETVEGRARLLRHVDGRGTAGAALRSAAVRRLATRLRVASTTPDPVALAAVAAARSGRPETEIREVLYGAEPPDDAALVRLAQQLPVLESELGQDAQPPRGGDR
jgi:hypothetical protein